MSWFLPFCSMQLQRSLLRMPLWPWPVCSLWGCEWGRVWQVPAQHHWSELWEVCGGALSRPQPALHQWNSLHQWVQVTHLYLSQSLFCWCSIYRTWTLFVFKLPLWLCVHNHNCLNNWSMLLNTTVYTTSCTNFTLYFGLLSYCLACNTHTHSMWLWSSGYSRRGVSS